MNQEDIHLSQTFRITNPDHMITHEEWTVVAMEDAAITFSVTKYYLRDIAYVHISSTDTIVGTVYQENERGVFLAFPPTYRGTESGIILKGDKATYIIKP